MIQAGTQQHSTTSPLTPPPLPAAPRPRPEPDPLLWFMRIRYSISLALFAILVIAYAIGVIPPAAAAKLAIANSLYLAATAFYNYLLNHNPSHRRLLYIRNAQVPEKLLLCTVALYYSGGALTPVFILYPLVILESIILTTPRGVYRTGLLAIAFYSSLTLLEAADAIPRVKSGWGSNWGVQSLSDQPLTSPGIAGTYTTYALYIAIVSSVLLLTAYIGNRVALLIRERNRQIETQLQDSQTLYDIANNLGNMVDEDRIYSYLASTLKSLHHAATSIVGMLDKDGSLLIKATSGEEISQANLTASAPGLVDLLQRGETLVIEDIQQHPDLKQLAYQPIPHSVYIFPIKLPLEQTGNLHTSTHPITNPRIQSAPSNKVKGSKPKIESTGSPSGTSNVLGGISLSFDTIKPLSPDLNSLMTTITTQAALAIQRAQLIADARRLANEMSQLYNLGLYTGSTLSRNEVLRRTSDNIESLMSPDAYYIALYDEVTNLLSFEVFVEHGRHIGKTKIPLDRGGVTSRVIQGGQPILVQDWSHANFELGILNSELDRSQTSQNSNTRKRVPEIQSSTPNMLSYLGVPMLWEDRVIGVISVQCEEPLAFDPHDQRLLAALAAQTAIALENAKLHQLAQDQSKLDSLTGVYNHGYFVELVRTAVAESDTDDTQVSLIMLDIDHFKHYNDSFGHVAGDNVLKMVAQALKKCVRETDAVGRWGGEEFGVLLLGIGITEAKKVARQIRRAVSELSPANGYGQVLPNPTISQGIASYPYPSATANDLIEEADTALYHAKKHGRNQLVVYEAAGGMKDDTTTTGHLTRSKAAKDLHITTDNMRRSKHAQHLDQELAATTNELAHNGEGTNPNLISTATRD